MERLSKETLQYVIDELLPLKAEVCGIVAPEDMRLVIQRMGENIEGRNLCTNTKYDKIIFHTHHYGAKPYPSAEDIVKVIKNEVIELSLIFTEWGVWQIRSMKKISRDNTEKVNELLKLSKFFMDKIYSETERGRVYKRDVISVVASEMNRKLRSFEFLIKFTHWNDLF
jgi:hypothetical protein